MKLFVWDGVTLNTESYHDGGSVIAIAETEERAKELVSHLVRDFEDIGPIVFPVEHEMSDFFPDSGCC
jgi:hypothetical protein